MDRALLNSAFPAPTRPMELTTPLSTKLFFCSWYNDDEIFYCIRWHSSAPLFIFAMWKHEGWVELGSKGHNTSEAHSALLCVTGFQMIYSALQLKAAHSLFLRESLIFTVSYLVCFINCKVKILLYLIIFTWTRNFAAFQIVTNHYYFKLYITVSLVQWSLVMVTSAIYFFLFVQEIFVFSNVSYRNDRFGVSITQHSDIVNDNVFWSFK